MTPSDPSITVALLTSDERPKHHNRPRRDIDLLAAASGVTVVPTPNHGWFRLFENIISSDLTHAFKARSLKPSVCLSFSERLGSASVLVNYRSRQICVAHNFNRPRRLLQRLTHWMNYLDTIVVVSTKQRELLTAAGIDSHKIKVVLDYVDTQYFNPELCIIEDGNAPCDIPGRYVLSVGQERRDYPLLLAALAETELPAIIVPSSGWVQSGGSPSLLPPSVTVMTNLSFNQLRNLYYKASCVVVPVLPDTEYAAGVNGLLEALAMAKPTIVTGTSGLHDYVNDMYMDIIPCGDHDALVAALYRHWDHPAGESNPEGRLAAVKKYSLERYVKALNIEVNRISGPRTPSDIEQ